MGEVFRSVISSDITKKLTRKHRMSIGGEEMGSKAHSGEERGAGESLEPLVASWPSWSLSPPAGARPQLAWLGTREDLLKPVQPARKGLNHFKEV